MSTSLAPYNYAHCWDEMRKGIDEQGPYYEVKYVFDDWSQSDAVINDLMGITTRFAGITTRNTPHQHPLSPNLYCTSAHAEGASGPKLNPLGYPGYTGAYFVRATYRGRSWQGVLQPSDDPGGNEQIDPSTPQLWCTQELDFDTETVVVPNHNFVWDSDGTATGVPLKAMVGLTIMRLTFHRVPFIPMPQFRTYRGHINSTVFLGAPVGCVLFKGGSTTRELSTDGTVNQRVSLTLIEREQNWNKYLRRSTITWDTMRDSLGGKTYQSKNLNGLLTAFA